MASKTICSVVLMANVSLTLASCSFRHEESKLGSDRASLTIENSEVSFGGFFGINATSARLTWAPEAPIAGAIVLSPGAYVPAEKMSGFAGRLAEKGFAVYTMHYNANLAIIPTEQKRAFDLAQKLNSNATEIRGLPEKLTNAHKAGLAISLMGHSMGGAVLGNLAGNQSAAFLNKIALLGVSSIVGSPAANSANVLLLVGTEDGLVSQGRPGENENEAAAMEAIFKTKTIPIMDVNHFCVVDDDMTGDSAKRAEDRPAKVDRPECQQRIADTAINAGI